MIDPYVTSRYKLQIDEAQRFNLTKRGFSFEEWVEPRLLKQAIKELSLEQYWKPRGLDGKASP